MNTLLEDFCFAVEQLLIVSDHFIDIFIIFLGIFLDVLDQLLIRECCLNEIFIIVFVFHLLNFLRAGIEYFAKLCEFFIILLLDSCGIFLHYFLCFVALIL